VALLRFNNTFIVQRSFAFAMERFLFHADFFISRRFRRGYFSPEILHWFIFRKNPLRSSRNLRATQGVVSPALGGGKMSRHWR